MSKQTFKQSVSNFIISLDCASNYAQRKTLVVEFGKACREAFNHGLIDSTTRRNMLQAAARASL